MLSAFDPLVQEWFGYCLSVDTSFQKFLILFGDGANGKGVLLACLIALLGDQTVILVAEATTQTPAPTEHPVRAKQDRGDDDHRDHDPNDCHGMAPYLAVRRLWPSGLQRVRAAYDPAGTHRRLASHRRDDQIETPPSRPSTCGAAVR